MVNDIAYQYESQPDAKDLKSRIDCRDIVRLHWGEPEHSTPRRDTYFSKWRPDGQKASFVVSVDGYKDFGGTRDSGDVFDFLMRELNLTFLQAVDWVTEYTHSSSQSITPRHKIERGTLNQPPGTSNLGGSAYQPKLVPISKF